MTIQSRFDYYADSPAALAALLADCVTCFTCPVNRGQELCEDCETAILEYLMQDVEDDEDE